MRANTPTPRPAAPLTTALRALALGAALAVVGACVPAPARATEALAATAPAATAPSATGSATTGSATAATERVLRYAIDWGPAALAKVEIRMTTDGDETRVVGEGKPAGLISIFSSFAVTQTSDYGPDFPRALTSHGVFGGDVTKRRVIYAKGAEPIGETIVESADPEPRTPIPDGALTSAVDPLFPVLEAMRSVEAGGACDSEHTVYTGRSAFRMIMTDKGDETLAKDRAWTWDGPARRCGIMIQRLGGFRIEKSQWSSEESEVSRDIWLARLPGGMAPVRMTVEAPVGLAVGRIDLR
jgi:hypothetical protein